MAIYIGVDINPTTFTTNAATSPRVATVEERIAQAAQDAQNVNANANGPNVEEAELVVPSGDAGGGELPLLDEEEVFGPPPQEASSFNPLWLLLAGAALGAVALSFRRGR